MAEPGETVTLTRKELYDLVWSTPMYKIAPEYGLSDVGLAKACDRVKVPTPYLGYWAKLQSGQKPKRSRLKVLPPAEEAELTLRLTKVTPSAPREATEADLLALQEKSPDKRIVVPDQVEKCHPLVKATRRMLEREVPYFGGFGKVSAGGAGCFSVSVCPEHIDRAMRILDALVRGIEDRGFPIAKESGCSVTILGEQIAFRMDEKIKRIDKHPPNVQARRKELGMGGEYDYLSTGKLSLTIDVDASKMASGQKKWSDALTQKLEDQLNSFVAGLIQASDAIKAERQRHEALEAAWKEQERKRRDAEMLKYENDSRIRRSQEFVKLWREAKELREFTAAVREEAIRRSGSIDPASEVGKWLAWAEQHAVETNPLSEKWRLPWFSR